MVRDMIYNKMIPWGKFIFTGLLLLSLSFLPACSRKKVPPPPKHHPDLLLEVLKAGAKEDYKQMLPRVKKLRALESSSVFLPELETSISLNILVREINHAALKADFARALSMVEQYEKFHGPGKQTTQVRLQLRNLLDLDTFLGALTRPPRTADALSEDLRKMEELGKKMKFSWKIRNFMAKKRSELTFLRKAEYRRMIFGLWSDTDFMVKTGTRDGAQALAAVFAGETEVGEGGYQLTLPGVRKEMLPPLRNTGAASSRK